MPSAEVFCWGTLAPKSDEECPVPVEAGRTGFVGQVYAGFGSAALAGPKGVTWVCDRSRLDGNTIKEEDGDDPWSLPGLECAALGQTHTLLLRKIAGAGESDGAEEDTQVLAWGSGRGGQVYRCL